MISKRELVGALLLFFAINGLAIYIISRSKFPANLKPGLDTRNPVAIEVEMMGERVRTITNTQPLLALLRQGRALSPHACAIPGRLIFRYDDGQQQDINIVPGHNMTNYEFHCANGSFAVLRGDFISILGSAGVDTNKVPME